MTLVKLHACKYRKVKSFPDIGVKLYLNLQPRERGPREKGPEKGFALREGAAPPVHWRRGVWLSIRPDGRVF
jgi:hypothetical protein